MKQDEEEKDKEQEGSDAPSVEIPPVQEAAAPSKSPGGTVCSPTSRHDELAPHDVVEEDPQEEEASKVSASNLLLLKTFPKRMSSPRGL